MSGYDTEKIRDLLDGENSLFRYEDQDFGLFSRVYDSRMPQISDFLEDDEIGFTLNSIRDHPTQNIGSSTKILEVAVPITQDQLESINMSYEIYGSDTGFFTDEVHVNWVLGYYNVDNGDFIQNGDLNKYFKDLIREVLDDSSYLGFQKHDPENIFPEESQFDPSFKY